MNLYHHTPYFLASKKGPEGQEEGGSQGICPFVLACKDIASSRITSLLVSYSSAEWARSGSRFLWLVLPTPPTPPPPHPRSLDPPV